MPPSTTQARSAGPASADSPAPVAVVCHTLPPYRQHLHRRIVAEERAIRLVTINTHHDRTRDWRIEDGGEIGLVDLARGDRMGGRRGPAAWWAERRRGRALVDVLREQRIRAVVMNGYNDAGRRHAIRWCRARGVPCFLWGDGNIASEQLKTGPAQMLKRRLVPRIVRQVTGCVACGRLGRELWESYGCPPEAVFISPYEPDYDQIRDLPQEAIVAARRRHGLSHDRRRLVFSGRLTAVKRVDLLVDAFVRLADKRPDWDLVLVGDGELRRALLSAVPARLAGRLVCTGFLADQRDVSAIYRASDVLVLPSTYEPWALVVNEAAAAGMAIVATDVVGAAAELVVDGVNGRVVPAADADALRQAVADVTDPAKTDRMKAASAGVLADWRRRGDPVEGLRDALRFAGVLPPA